MLTTNNQIQTYDTKSFLNKFTSSKELFNVTLKEDLGKLFIVKVEEMLQMMKLPVPPSRATTHGCIYLTSGEAKITIGSKDYTIHQGEILIIPSGQVFSAQNLDINKGYFFNFHNDILHGKFNNNDLLNSFEFLKVWGNPLIKLDEQTSKFVLHIFDRIYFDYCQNGIKNIDIIQSYLITLLCEINRVYKTDLEGNNLASLIITRKFKELLFLNFKNKHLVTDYSEIMYISPNHLNKCVKSVTGKSTTKWIDEAIVLEAKVLLHQSNLSISDIASELGYYEQSYFSRIFKKYEGITPLDFRKRIEKY